ncbi:phage tail protein, partial [bacterium]|nr:phage tail protein [bacterium]
MCAGTTVTLNPVLTGNANAIPSFIASSGTIAGGPYPAPYTYTPSIASGSVTLTATTNDPAGGCNAGTDNLIITVNQPVAITSQPLATQTVCSGTNVTFSVAATGTGLSYQWRRGTLNLINGGNISGATSPTLTLTGVSSADEGTYSVVVSGASPCPAVTSDNAELVVHQVVAITAQPVPTQTACSGSSVSFTVAATGDGLTYQWRRGSTPLTDGGAISGANSPSLTINPVLTSDAANDYNVIITGIAPCDPVTSSNAALIVNESVVINSQPEASQTVCSGATVTFNVAASGTGLSYQWRRGIVNLTNGGNVTGATSPTLTLTGVSSADEGTYTVVVSGASPCTSVTSADADLIVHQAVAITAQPAPTQTACSGSPVSFSVTATGDGLAYQWYRGATPLTNGGAISGATSSTLTINPVLAADAAADYHLIISGIAPCGSVTSSNAVILVNEAVSITSQPLATQSACTGNTVTFTVSATGTGLNYQWRRGITNLVESGNISGVNSATLTVTNVTTANAAPNYNVVITGTAPCSPVTSGNASLTVFRAVTINTQPTNVGICASSPAQLGVIASGDGLTY